MYVFKPSKHFKLQIKYIKQDSFNFSITQDKTKTKKQKQQPNYRENSKNPIKLDTRKFIKSYVYEIPTVDMFNIYFMC